jgi:two-component sensor histidine kinase
MNRTSGDESGPKQARSFLEGVAANFAGARQQIRIDCDPELRLSAAELAALGAIASEAVANALTHAFPAGREGRIWLRLALEDGRVKLTVRDDGIGMPDLPSGRSFIEGLARQLGGYASLGSAPFSGGLVSVAYPRHI